MDNLEKIRLGRRVTALMKERKIKRIDFAYKTGLNKDTLLKIEQGRSNVTLSSLVKIAKGFDMTVSELTEGIDADR